MEWEAPWRSLFCALGGSACLGLVREAHRTHPLSSPVRLNVYRLIVSKPGISLREIAETLGTTWGNVKYHTMRLEAAGLVGTRVAGRRRLCFPRSRAEDALVEARAILREPTARRIALYLVDHPGASIARVIAETGESQRVVYYHVKRFVEAGLVTPSDGGTYRALVPTGELYSALL